MLPVSARPATYRGLNHDLLGYADTATTGSLDVRVVEATELVEKRKEKKSRGFFGTSSESAPSGPSADAIWPYVTIRAGNVQGSTPPIRKSSPAILAVSEAKTGCEWEEEFTFDEVKATQQITVTCYLGRSPKDAGVSDERKLVVGEVTIPVVRLPEGHAIEQWYQLVSREPGKLSKAAIKLRLLYQVREAKAAGVTAGGSFDPLPVIESPLTPSTADGLDVSLSAIPSLMPASPSIPPDTPGSVIPEHTPREGSAPASPPSSATPNNLEELGQEEMPTGLVDYFCVVGPMIDPSTGLPMLHKAEVLMRYPPDKADMPLPDSPQFFCFPAGLELHYGPAPPQPEPLASSFIIRHSGVSMYGVCLHFHRKWDQLSKEAESPSALGVVSLLGSTALMEDESGSFSTAESSSLPQPPPSEAPNQPPQLPARESSGPKPDKTVWAPVCFCLLTRVPVIEPLLSWLVQAYDHIDSLLPSDFDSLVDPESAEGVLSELFRSQIVQITEEVPLPIPGALGVHFSFMSRSITCSLPGPGSLPPLTYPLSTFLQTFSPRTIVTLIGAALTETKIVLHSTDLALLPILAESLVALMYPLQWQDTYLVPLPYLLLTVFDSPTKYILGVHSSWLSELSKDSMREVLLVDCDTGLIKMPARPYQLPPLPSCVAEPLYRRLRAAVHPALDHMDSAQVILDEDTLRASRLTPQAEYDLRVQFARSMAYLLSGYHDCVFYIDPSSPIFNQSRFMSEYAPVDEQPFLACLLTSSAFQIFLQSQEDPYMEFFRRLLHQAYNRTNSRPLSPPTQQASTNVPKRNVADFQIVAEEVGWATDPEAVDVFASPTGGTPASKPSRDGGVRLMLMVPRPPELSTKGPFGQSVDVSLSGAGSGQSLMSTVMSPEESGDRQTTPQLFLERSSSQHRSVSGMSHGVASATPTVTHGSVNPQDEEALEEPTQAGGDPGAEEVREPGRTAGRRVMLSLNVGSNDVGESGASLRSTMDSPTKEAGQARRRGSRKLTLAILASPTKGRTQSLEEFELEALMRQKGAVSTPWTTTRRPSIKGLSGLGSSEHDMDGAGVRAAAEWREPRRYTVEEVAQIMQISVRDFARALGLSFDLQRVITRGHTIFGFHEQLSMNPGQAGSPHGCSDEAQTTEIANLNLAVQEAFKAEAPSKELMAKVEVTFRIKDVRTKFLSLLNQPRNKRMHYQKGGPTGQFRVHSNGFEALMQLASGACTACAKERDYITAHTLLQLMGRYYRVLESKESQSAWMALRDSQQQQKHKEFLSSRLRLHEIFRTADLWVHVLRDQLTDDVGVGRGARPSARRDPAGKGQAPTPGGVATGELDARRLGQKIKSLLLEMRVMDLPHHEAEAFVRRACDEYKMPPEARDVLEKLEQRIWRVVDSTTSQGDKRLMDLVNLGKGGSATSREKEGPPGFFNTPRDGDDKPFAFTQSAAGLNQTRRVSFSQAGDKVVPVTPGNTQYAPQPTPSSVRRPSGTGATLAQFIGAENNTHKGPVLCVDVDSEGSLGVSGGADKLLVVYSLMQKTRVASFTGHTGPIMCVSIFRDRKGEPIVASASMDSTLRIWRLTGNGSQVVGEGSGDSLSQARALLASFANSKDVRNVLTGHSRGVVCMDKSQELQVIATGAMDKVVKIWDVEQGRNTATLVGHQGTVSCVRIVEGYHPFRVLSGGHDKSLMVWDASQPEGTCVRSYRSHESWIRALRSWGKDVAITASNDKTLRVWDVRVHNCVQKLVGHCGAVTCMEASGDYDAPLLFSGSTDATVRVWDLRGGGRSMATLEGHVDAVTGVGLHMTQGVLSKLVSVGEDKRVVEWDARTGNILQSRMGHRGGITCLSVTHDAIVTGSWDQSVRIWSPAQGALLSARGGPGM